MLRADTTLYAPALTSWATGDGVHIVLDAEGPNWVATDARGARLLSLIDGRRTVAELAIAADLSRDPATAMQHAHSLLSAAGRAGLIADAPFERPAYEGRAARLTDWRLREFWVHSNNSCNLRCEHCLVSSGPEGDRGLSTARLTAAIEEAAALGAERVFFTGGEPLLRRDLATLVERVTASGMETIILTNATLLDRPEYRATVGGFDRSKVRFQVSIDGATAADNDPLRGEGTFERAHAGVLALAEMGFEVSLAAVPTARNLARLDLLPALTRDWRAASLHLMWPHRRGRGLAMLDAFPAAEALLPVVRAVREAAHAAGVRLDNEEGLRSRANAIAGVKHDLGMAAVETLCLDVDGTLYPSAAMVGVEALAIGRLDARPMGDVWRESPVAKLFREASVVAVPSAMADPLRFITGGGDIEHAWFWSGAITGEDPYAPMHSALTRDVIEALGRAGRDRVNHRGGSDAPMLFHAMGDGALACGDELPGSVRAVHSNCVLAFDVDRPRALVRAFYGDAAEQPKADLCCPVRPSPADIAHIPRDVIDRFYGCGSPVADAALAPGERHLDLGSGAGIDVFIAARRVGPMGRSIGVDMTDAMLAVASENRPIVAERLGYDVVSFEKGLLERIPLADRSIDCVTSNCVVNLSPDKRAVFLEVWRVLRDHGRFVFSDIVADRAVPPHMRVNSALWGECLSGALTEAELYYELERAGFHGVALLTRSRWREVDGHAFFSVTVRAYKHAVARDEARDAFEAVYLGPYTSVVDDSGQVFRRGEPATVPASVAERLRRAPYATSFIVTGADQGSDAPKRCC